MPWKWPSMNWLYGRTPARALQGLHSEEQLRRILTRERARADRNGHYFSLAVFDVANANGEVNPHRGLADVLSRRLRSTDEVGWFDARRIGVVLPDTPGEAARRVADDVCQLAQATAPRPACMVYTYPATWRRDDHDRRDRQPPSPGSGAGDTEAREGSASLEEPGGRTPDTTQQSQAPSSGGASAPGELEGLFSTRLPTWKLVMDKVGAVVGLVVFSPVMLAAAIAVKLTSKGPVIFSQKRVGRAGKLFTFYKFRTMHLGAGDYKSDLLRFNEQTGPVFKMKGDPRITQVGRFLRTTSIDELPQLWNVLKGDMSLVGPRPPTLDEVKEYDRWHRRRLDLTPGLTCIWQVSGRSLIGFEDWVRMDLRYAETRSLFVDLSILLRTVPAVLSGRGAH